MHDDYQRQIQDLKLEINRAKLVLQTPSLTQGAKKKMKELLEANKA
jgi:hypothetical protein